LMGKRPGIGFGVMIMNGGKILLGKRHENPEKASSLLHGEGTWTMPGGKLDFGEKLHDGALREVKEETGIDMKAFEVVSITNDIVHDDHFVTVGFKCTDFRGEPRTMEPDEIVEWKWFDMDSLPENTFPPSRKIVENFRKRVIYDADD
jgi:8-oxo-dGTP diphosphatase